MAKAPACTITTILLTVKRVDRKDPPKFCGIPNCVRTHSALNLCWAHYMKFYKWRKANDWTLPEYDYHDLSAFVQPHKGIWEIDVRDLHCHVPDCDKEYLARGFCRPHYLMWWKGEKRNAKSTETN
jgi:hypothetical protein